MNDLSTLCIAKKNIQNKPSRSYGLKILTGILCFILFFSSFLMTSLNNGLDSLSKRMGADIIVVPEGYDSKITSSILRGEPNTFFFDKSVLDRVKKVNGVELASPQIFLATLSAGCCSFPIQIIGIDFDTDFTVKAWLQKQVKFPLKEGEIIVGNNIIGDTQSHVKFFNRPFTIKGRLSKTGMGFDNSVFMSMEETAKLALEFEKLLTHPLSNDQNLISSVMIKVAKGADVRKVQQEIRGMFKGEGVYPLISREMVTEVSDNIKNLMLYMKLLLYLLWTLVFTILVIVYNFSIKERKREFAIFRILGATNKKIKNICLVETLLINGTGAAFGGISAFVISILFGTAISQTLNMPFLRPQMGISMMLLFITIALGTLLGPLAALFAVIKMDKQEMALLLRENE